MCFYTEFSRHGPVAFFLIPSFSYIGSAVFAICVHIKLFLSIPCIFMYCIWVFLFAKYFKLVMIWRHNFFSLLQLFFSFVSHQYFYCQSYSFSDGRCRGIAPFLHYQGWTFFSIRLEKRPFFFQCLHAILLCVPLEIGKICLALPCID